MDLPVIIGLEAAEPARHVEDRVGRRVPAFVRRQGEEAARVDVPLAGVVGVGADVAGGTGVEGGRDGGGRAGGGLGVVASGRRCGRGEGEEGGEEEED